MMHRRVAGVVALLVTVAAAAFASRKDEVTLVLVPREDAVVRVGMDIANRYPTLLMSYKAAPNGKVSLHGWTGKEWVNVGIDDFQSGSFFRTGPDSALIVEKAGEPLPEGLVPPESWCDSVYMITTTELRPLLHLVGQYYDFKYKQWEWFSENYKLPISDINPEGLNIAWYHKRLGDHFKSVGNVGANDLSYWVAIRHPQPPKEEPVAEEAVVEEVQEEAEAPPEEAQPEMETPEDPDVDPFATDAPEAVVLGAGTAEEAVVEAQATEKDE